MVPPGLFRAFPSRCPSTWFSVASLQVSGRADRVRRIRWMHPFYLIQVQWASFVIVRIFQGAPVTRHWSTTECIKTFHTVKVFATLLGCGALRTCLTYASRTSTCSGAGRWIPAGGHGAPGRLAPDGFQIGHFLGGQGKDKMC